MLVTVMLQSKANWNWRGIYLAFSAINHERSLHNSSWTTIYHVFLPDNCFHFPKPFTKIWRKMETHRLLINHSSRLHVCGAVAEESCLRSIAIQFSRLNFGEWRSVNTKWRASDSIRILRNVNLQPTKWSTHRAHTSLDVEVRWRQRTQ